MIERLKQRMKQEKGFTLVELLAVIAILGIVVAIAVPTVGNVIDNSKDEAKKANTQLIENAARLADLDEKIGGKNTYTLKELNKGGYLEEIPENPETGDSYKGNEEVTKQEDGSFKFGDDEDTGGEGNTKE